MTVAVEGHSPELAPSQPRPSPRRQLVAGRFRLIEQLGRGGMGRVFRAHDEVLDRPVAVKLIYDDAVRDRDLEHACALEARAAARLNHPGIVRILDSGFDDGHCYVVMSLAEGRTLAEILREDGPLPVDRALNLAIQVADALAAAHSEGVIHCDVKPGNLLVDAGGRVRLVDFGIARVTSSTTGLTGELLQGSAQYVAPEQVEGASVDGRTDLYALGTVLYEMLAGQTPFGGGTIASILARRLVNDPPPLRETNPTVPPQVEQIVLKALARDPDARIQTAAELRDALLAIRKAVPVFPAPPRRRGQPDRPSRWSEIRSAGLTTFWLHLRRLSQAILAGAAQAAGWTAGSGRRVREAAGSTLPDAMTRAQLLTPARRPTLRAGVGLAMLLGLLMGATAAKCGVAGVSAEPGIASAPRVVMEEQRMAATPTVAAVPVAPVATQPAPPTAVPPTATAPAPTPTAEPAIAEVEAAPPPAPTAPRPPVRALSAPPPTPVAPAESEAVPPSRPSDTTEKDDDKKEKNTLSNTPRSDEKTPEERAKADAKKNEEEKRAAQPKPARASTLAPYVGKPEPTRQQAPQPNPRSAAPPPTQVAPKPETKKPEQPPPATKNEQQRGSEKRKERDD